MTRTNTPEQIAARMRETERRVQAWYDNGCPAPRAFDPHK